MSHFLVGVILNVNEKDPKYKLAQLMAPYDEGIEVPAYSRSCYCIDSDQSFKVRTELERLGLDIEELRKSFNYEPWPENATPEQSDAYWEGHQAAWEEHTKEYSLKREELFTQITGDPDPSCEDCHGTGVTQTTYNPKSKWDYYTVGGRWSDDTPSVAKVQEAIDKNIIPFAIVTPDGEWHEKGRMGWWAIVADEKKDWKDIALGIYTQYSTDHYVAFLDCHI